MDQKRAAKSTSLDGIPALLETLSLTLCIASLWYFIYYLIAPWVWSQNIHFNPSDLTPWIRGAVDGDGVEIYALYILMFLNIASALTLPVIIAKCTGKMVRCAVVAVSLAASFVYCAKIGFTPPMTTLGDGALSATILESLLIILVVTPLLTLLYFLQRRFPLATVALAAVLLAPACLIATQNTGWQDYTYIFSPALRLLHGAPLSDIYFQYDLMLSLFAEVWMKLGLALDSFQILGQWSYLITILGVFLLSGKLFRKSELSLLLLMALILGRIYASPYDAILVFQVTPLRLDLWLPLLVLAYYLGPYHWSLGVYCALLVLIHKNFGIIYSAAYLQLHLTIGVIAWLDSEKKGGRLAAVVHHGKRCLPPVVIITVSWAVNHALFKNDSYANFAGYYQKIGIGFMKIAPTSFYWYVPPLLSATVILLFRLRHRVSPAYLVTGFLLTYCAIGNSIYFFGRSHENNILNIAIVLLFLFFFLLDLMSRSLDEENGSGTVSSFLRRNSSLGIGLICIVTIIVSYSHNIFSKAGIQIENAKTGQFIYPVEQDPNMQGYLNRIRQVTGNSSKVYFIDEYDFTFYYYGGYAPVGYPNPFRTWIFKKDLNRFLQGLLDNGYHLVCNGSLKYILPDLHYSTSTPVGENIVVSKPRTGARPDR